MGFGASHFMGDFGVGLTEKVKRVEWAISFL